MNWQRKEKKKTCREYFYPVPHNRAYDAVSLSCKLLQSCSLEKCGLVFLRKMWVDFSEESQLQQSCTTHDSSIILATFWRKSTTVRKKKKGCVVHLCCSWLFLRETSLHFPWNKTANAYSAHNQKGDFFMWSPPVTSIFNQDQLKLRFVWYC